MAKIFVRILLPRPDLPPDTHDTVTLYETAITTAHEKTLNPSHRRFITEHGSQPPFSTLLLASYDADAHFGIATVAFIAPDHRLYLSVHDYWSEDRNSFETFFKDIVLRFAPIHTQA